MSLGAGGFKLLVARPDFLDGPVVTGVISSGVVSMVALACQGLIRLAYTLAIGRIIGVEALGVATSAVALATIVSLLNASSLGPAAAKYVTQAFDSGDVGEFGAFFRRRGLQVVLLSSVLAGAVGLLLFDIKSDWPVILSLAILTAGLCGLQFCRGCQYAMGLYVRAAFWDIALGLVSLAALVGFTVYVGVGQFYLMPLALGLVAYSAICWPKATGVNIRPQNFRHVDRFVWVAALGSLASSGLLQLSSVFARWLHGDFSAGIFGAALAVATPLALISSALGVVIFPRLSRSAGSGDRLAFVGTVRRYATPLSMMVAVICAAVSFLAPLGFSLLWGNQFLTAVPSFRLLAAGVSIMSLTVISTQALSAGSEGGIRIAATWSVVGLIVGVSAMWLLETTGVIGIAAGFLLGVVVTSIGIFVSSEALNKWARPVDKIVYCVAILMCVAAAVIGL